MAPPHQHLSPTRDAPSRRPPQAAPLVLTNVLAEQSPENELRPVHQFWGSPEIEVALGLHCPSGLENLEQSYERSRRYQAQFGPYIADRTGLEPGYWLVRENLLNNLGLKWAACTGLQRQTVPQVSAGEEGELYLHFLIPCTALPLQAGDPLADLSRYDLSDPLKFIQFAKFDGQIARTTEDFKRIVLKELEIEAKLQVVPLYPDLYLPTWETLGVWATSLGVEFTPPTEKCFFVDPDFYIDARDPYADDSLISIKDALEGVDEGQPVTFVSRFRDAATTIMDDRTDPPPQSGGMDGADEGDAAQQEVDPNLVLEDVLTGETVLAENPHQDPGVLPLKAAVKGAFHDLTFQTPLNRLAAAFPTVCVLFYRDGKWIGLKRMWDQFYGRLPIRYVKVTRSMDRPDDVALIGLSAHALGATGRDITENVELWSQIETVREKAKTDPAGISVGGFAWEVATQAFDEWRTKILTSKSGSDAPGNEALLQRRWQDLSNALVIAPGTRVHVRMGYGSTLQRLPTVFNGCIAEVEATPDGMDIACSGDGVELENDLFLRRLAGKESGEQVDDLKSEFRRIYPRKWLLDILGSYNGGFFDKLKTELAALSATDSFPIHLADNTYGIEHFGSPIPIFHGRTNTSLTHTPFEIGSWNYVNATEHGQNIFHPSRGGIDFSTESQLNQIGASLTGTPDNAAQQQAQLSYLSSAADYVVNDLKLSSRLEGVVGPIVERYFGDTDPQARIREATEQQRGQFVLDVLGALSQRAALDQAVGTQPTSFRTPASPLSPLGMAAGALATPTEEEIAAAVAGRRAGEAQDAAKAILNAARSASAPKPNTLSAGSPQANAALFQVTPELLQDTDQLDQMLRDLTGVNQAQGGVLLNKFGEYPIRIDIHQKSFWDIAWDLAKLTPGFIAAVHPFGVTRSTFFWGKPHFPLAYTYGLETGQTVHGWQRWVRNYDTRNDRSALVPAGSGATEVIKTFAQCHLAHGRWGLLQNAIRLNREELINRGTLYQRTETGELEQTGKAAQLLSGVQVEVVQIDDDILPEEQRDERIVVPFAYSWLTSLLGASEEKARYLARVYGYETLAQSARTIYDGHLVLMGNGCVKPWDFKMTCG